MEQDELILHKETVEIEGGRKLYRYTFSGTPLSGSSDETGSVADLVVEKGMEGDGSQATVNSVPAPRIP
ncbi:MAG: hypothetical protein WAO58_10505 [Fimbriimonadaceae bacterium]